MVALPYKDPAMRREYQRLWQIKYRLDQRAEREKLGIPSLRETHPKLYAYLWPGRARRQEKRPPSS
ncbi:MAG: hypothetical protein AB1609_15320 [Bacillota bacterium]